MSFFHYMKHLISFSINTSGGIKDKMLSKEEYKGGLYDIGYDKPETHVIAKGDTLFYAFYDEKWIGEIALRGLDEATSYVALDYFNNEEIS